MYTIIRLHAVTCGYLRKHYLCKQNIFLAYIYLFFDDDMRVNINVIRNVLQISDLLNYIYIGTMSGRLTNNLFVPKIVT